MTGYNSRTDIKQRNRIDIAPQALMMAAGVIVSVVLISIMVNQLDTAKTMARTVGQSISRATKQLSLSEIMQYDGMKVSGAEVRNFYKMHLRKRAAEGPECMTIDNSFSRETYDDPLQYGKLTNEREYTYVDPLDVYKCTVCQNDNGIITEVIFEIQTD